MHPTEEKFSLTQIVRKEHYKDCKRNVKYLIEVNVLALLKVRRPLYEEIISYTNKG